MYTYAFAAWWTPALFRTVTTRQFATADTCSKHRAFVSPTLIVRPVKTFKLINFCGTFPCSSFQSTDLWSISTNPTVTHRPTSCRRVLVSFYNTLFLETHKLMAVATRYHTMRIRRQDDPTSFDTWQSCRKCFMVPMYTNLFWIFVLERQENQKHSTTLQYKSVTQRIWISSTGLGKYIPRQNNVSRYLLISTRILTEDDELGC